MSERGPMVIRGAAAAVPSGPPTAGMERRQLLHEGERWFGWVRTEPGLAGGWHHHGDHDSYVYVVRGSITMEYGQGGAERVEAGPGDLVFNPARLVHREITGPGEPTEAFVVRIGTGPLNVNVDGPDADPA